MFKETKAKGRNRSRDQFREMISVHELDQPLIPVTDLCVTNVERVMLVNAESVPMSVSNATSRDTSPGIAHNCKVRYKGGSTE